MTTQILNKLFNRTIDAVIKSNKQVGQVNIYTAFFN